MKFAAYIRTATNNPQAIECQLTLIRTWVIEEKGTMSNVYIDEGVSGISLDRPELERLIADADDLRFDAVAVTTLDRISRKPAELESICTQLLAYKVHIIAAREPESVPWQAISK